jgi:signal transduction histidine kinase
MNIRTKLTLRFILITAIIFLVSFVLIFVLSADYRAQDFHSRLFNNANNAAKLLTEIEQVNSTLLRRIEQDNPVNLPDEKIIIYDSLNQIAFSTDEARAIRVDEELLSRIRIAGDVRFRQDGYEALGFNFVNREKHFVVVAAARDIYGLKRLKNLSFILILVFGISTIIVSISAWMYAGKALKPIAAVVERVSEISISSMNLRVDEGNGRDEIARLAHTFNNMLSRLETPFIIQKNFIANASHELRTPLTAITGQLEVTLLNTRSAEAYAQVLHSVLEDIKKLNTLSNRLLLLAQASSENLKMTPLRIDEVIWEVKDDLSKLHPAFLIDINFDENLDDESKLTVKADEHLIKTALSNVIENGCKFSSNKTTHVFIGESPAGLSLTFKDSGIGIPANDLPNIFQPFYRGSNTKTTKGHGIGLSMVHAIISVHSGKIEISSAENAGTMIVLTLPIATEPLS